MQHTIRVHLVLALFLMLGTCTFAQLAPSVFTYQGALRQNGENANVSVPMSFRLYDTPSGGSQIGSGVSFGSVDVVDGLFSVRLDFGAVASSTNAIWLEIEVDGFTLSPRESITGSPYSVQTRGIHVDDTGRVGVGTITPGEDVEIAKDGVSVRIRSTMDFEPSLVTLQGSVPGLGGVYSRISFENGFGAEIFDLQHDTAFGVDYFTFKTAAYPSGLIRVREDGAIGIGDLPALSPLHVVDRDIGVFNDGMLNETLSLEDNDAVLGIYSSNTGSFGSALVFGESVGNAVVDKWGMVRTTSNTAPELRVTYGPNPNYAQNASSVTFVPGGMKFADGSVQYWAGVVDSFSDSQISITNISASGIFPDPAIVTISAAGQSILVNAFACGLHGADGFSSVRYVLAYRLAGSSSTPVEINTARFVGEDNTGSVNIFEPFVLHGNTILSGLAPGTYEIGLFIRQTGDAMDPARFQSMDISAIVF